MEIKLSDLEKVSGGYNGGISYFKCPECGGNVPYNLDDFIRGGDAICPHSKLIYNLRVDKDFKNGK